MDLTRYAIGTPGEWMDIDGKRSYAGVVETKPHAYGRTVKSARARFEREYPDELLPRRVWDGKREIWIDLDTD